MISGWDCWPIAISCPSETRFSSRLPVAGFVLHAITNSITASEVNVVCSLRMVGLLNASRFLQSPCAQSAGDFAMAGDAERAHVLETGIAAFDDRSDVIGLPPRLAPAMHDAELLLCANLAHPLGEGEAQDLAAQPVRIE